MVGVARGYDPPVRSARRGRNRQGQYGGSGTADGTIVGLLVSEGDTVDMGAAIAEMEVEGAEPEQKPVADASGDGPSGDGPSVPLASRVGSMIVGANVGPTGGEFTDTSLQPNRRSWKRQNR